jgi:8-oxo-dGTP pyrophosphatase MutT (NUDIX family)
MSHHEKLLILNMDYSAMWWYVWLNNPERGLNILVKNPNNDYRTYFKQKNKFDTKMAHDGGKRLQELINNSTSYDPIWEIPKGGKSHNERDIDAAIREFQEETQIDPKYINILYNVRPAIISKKSNGILYKFIYYIAELSDLGLADKKVNNPKIDFNSGIQISEIYDIKWISESFIHNLTMNNCDRKLMLTLYRNVVTAFKKNNSVKLSRLN